METLKKLCVLTAILFFSCNTSDEPIIELTAIDPEPDQESYMENPYHDLGGFYHKLLSTYQTQQDLKVNDINEQLHYTLITNDLTILKAKSGVTSAKYTTEGISISDLIDNSSLSQLGKASLYGFTQDLLSYNGEEVGVVLQAIDSYESQVINNSNLSSYDQQVILIFISLVKGIEENQSNILLDEEDKQNDADWYIIIGNMYGYLNIALSQSPEDMANEIFKSLNGL